MSSIETTQILIAAFTSLFGGQTNAQSRKSLSHKPGVQVKARACGSLGHSHGRSRLARARILTSDGDEEGLSVRALDLEHDTFLEAEASGHRVVQ